MPGSRCWVIAEGCIPGDSVSEDPKLVSHETACILNAGERSADVTITNFLEDRDPVGPCRLSIPGRRTHHMRFNDLRDPAPVPRDTSYASLIESNEPVVVQHTRPDSRDPHIALLSTIAYPLA